jgi:hypothetical protein
MIEKLTKYLKSLECELIMSAYLDGWHILWLKEKIEKTKNEILCLKR